MNPLPDTPIPPAAEAIIRRLGLMAHPEGGFFRETWRDHPAGGGRGHGTAIYYLLARGQVSAWHRVDATEIWHWYGGAPLVLEQAGDPGPITRATLGPDLAAGQEPQLIVPAGHWQSARSLGDWTLVGCTVSPAFEFGHYQLAPPDWQPGEAVAAAAVRPLGVPVPGWTPRQRPPHTVMTGRFGQVEPLDPDRHGADLWQANATDAEGALWTYLGYGPFPDPAAYRAWLIDAAASPDPLYHAICEPAGRAVGVGTFMRIDPGNGVIEIGHLAFSPLLQRTPLATEALFLMLTRAFDQLGYRRCEWKCDSLNGPSRSAAQRLGFRYEGTFRQAAVTKGRNRDTAWFSITDAEWPVIKTGFRLWLDPENFTSDGRQKRSLAACRAAAAG